MSLRLVSLRVPARAALVWRAACLSILLLAAPPSAGHKLYVGGLAWDSGGGAPRMKIRPLGDRILVERTTGSGGSTSAEAYVETAPGTGMLMSLPNPFGATDSGADNVDCEDSSGLCIASGAAENTGGDPQPILWECTTSACTVWVTTLLPLPSGYTSGAGLGVFIPQPSGLVDSVVVGWTSGPSGVAKATAWLPNVTGGWTATLLPELGSLPTPPKESVALNYQKINSAHAVVAGTATNDSGQSKPVAWYYDIGLGSWGAPVALPLSLGSTEGAAMALAVTDGTPGSRILTIAGVEEIDDGGTPGTRAVLLQCTTASNPATDCGATAWSSTSLAPLPGHGSSSTLDVSLLPDGSALLAGTSYPSSADPYTTGEATLWIVDSATQVIRGTVRASDITDGFAGGDEPRVLTSLRSSPGNGLAAYAASGTKLDGGPRRWLLTDAPWNRRIAEIELVPSGGGSLNAVVRWRIDLAGSVAGDTELGASVGLEINAVPESTTDQEPCLIWELDAGGAYSCEDQPDGGGCGTATLNGNPVTLTCDSREGTCGADFTTVFGGLSLTGGDTVKATLTALRTTETEIVPEDDWLEVTVSGFEIPLLSDGGFLALGVLLLASGWLVVRKRSRELA